LRVDAYACPKSCGFNYNPVCGSNGKSFLNECRLEAAACQIENGQIVLVHRGRCSGRCIVKSYTLYHINHNTIFEILVVCFCGGYSQMGSIVDIQCAAPMIINLFVEVTERRTKVLVCYVKPHVMMRQSQWLEKENVVSTHWY